MKIISIDLAIHQTGVSILTVPPSGVPGPKLTLQGTITFKETLGSKYKVLDWLQLHKMEQPGGFLNWLYRMYEVGDIILIEWNPSSLSHLLEKFTIEVVSYLWGKGYKVVPMQANRWMNVADDYFAIKRSKYPNDRNGNKKWISDLAISQLVGVHQYGSQDEMDATVMGITYFYNPQRFL